MTTEEVTLVAALIAALTSIVTLGLNTRLAILKEKRMLLWGNELNRLLELEELIGVAREVAKGYHNKVAMDERFPPVHRRLQDAAGEFSRYRELSQTIRDVTHACAVVVELKNESGDYRDWKEKLDEFYQNFLEESDKITKR